MIKIYDTNHNFLSLLDSFCKDIYTIDTLELGIRELCFLVPCKDEYFDMVQEENYVETADYSYVIKEVQSKNNSFIAVRCGPNIEALQGHLFQHFDCFELGLPQAYEYCVATTGW
jgi:hypothetical protein